MVVFMHHSEYKERVHYLDRVPNVDSQNGHVFSDQVEGKLVTRVGIGLDVLARLQHQMQQVLLSMRQGNGNGAKREQTVTSKIN